MAIIKHIASKNSDYGAAERYLTHQYDEFTNKPILDDSGHLLQRDNYLIDGINCTPDTFAIQCLKTNKAFHKNCNRSEIKSHHYIISFDPRDVSDNQLTVERAQRLGIKFASEFFPGYQTLVCTHPDGHNGTGNIHIHIIINSIRMYSVPHQEYMERPGDLLAGHKHHVTNLFMTHLKQAIMDLCQEEQLYQVDLLSPAKIKITDREYWQQRRANQNSNIEDQSISERPTEHTKSTFETTKSLLRKAVDQVLHDSFNYEEFKNRLFSEYGILVQESRGRISYHLSDRNKPISSGMLGTNYSKTFILEFFQLQSMEQQNKSILQQLSRKPDSVRNHAFTSDKVRRSTDLAECLKARKSLYYERKVEASNLLIYSQTLIFLEKHQIKTQSDLDQLILSVTADVEDKKSKLNTLSTGLKQTNQLIKATGQYLSYKSVYKKYCSSNDKKTFYDTYHTELALFDAAKQTLSESGYKSPPSLSSLKEQKANILQERNQIYEDYSFSRSRQAELQNINHNIQKLLETDRYEHQIPENTEIR